MKNIILPTDFSHNSWNAIAYAVQLFKNEECNFFLLNTYKLTVYGAEFTVQNPAEFGLLETIKTASKDGLEKMSRRIQDYFKNPKHTITQVSSFNSISGATDELQREHKIDFIVMGTKGATGAMKVLFGSNTVDVLNDAKCPTLAIPNDLEFETPKNILFPSDYKIEFKENHLKPILDIATQYQSKVNSLHVYFERKLSVKQIENRNLLEAYFEGTDFELHTKEDKKIPEVVKSFQKEHNINLLVMINNKHSFFENLFFKNKINEIGFDLEIPFLVIPS
ncbi:universal stress protein [Brumimicrobium oceani]|uniref:Universal stress protein n=1 Tax=Brumimicrobium oceani TaxID=2100725 RepID=A0A2U2XC47_9FLAO|nr:universal stress protein [Brumimicrobium oceani]PWH85362.1 universal stress protein [Brumimicrobium oceani]